jgi:hypothetical protein
LKGVGKKEKERFVEEGRGNWIGERGVRRKERRRVV